MLTPSLQQRFYNDKYNKKMKTEKGIFEVEINNGEKVKVYQMKINGERWYSVFDSPYAYDTKQEIKECKYLNQSKITKTL